MNLEEFLAKHEAEKGEREREARERQRAREAAEDAYYDAMGEEVERHPIGRAAIFRQPRPASEA